VYVYIYIYNLHIHIGTITISGGRGDHQTLGHIYICVCMYMYIHCSVHHCIYTLDPIGVSVRTCGSIIHIYLCIDVCKYATYLHKCIEIKCMYTYVQYVYIYIYTCNTYIIITYPHTCRSLRFWIPWQSQRTPHSPSATEKQVPPWPTWDIAQYWLLFRAASTKLPQARWVRFNFAHPGEVYGETWMVS